MSAADWVGEKYSAAPRDLLRAMTAEVEKAGGSNPTAQLTSASGAVTRRIAAQGCSDRAHAIDLLTLDALLTGAMESSATSAASCEAAASRLLSVISEAAAIE